MHGGFTTGAALALSIFCIPAWAGRIDVSTADNLQSKIDSAAPGDVIHLSSGEHVGRVHLKESLTLEGEPGAVLRGRGKGSVITVDGHDATVRGLIVRRSGRSLEKMDSGVFLERTASRAVVERNVLEDNLFGVYVHGAKDSLVKDNSITGLRGERLNETGNGVTVWNASGAKVVDNDISFGRDGIFVISSRNNVFSGNVMRKLRYAVHYMYAGDSEVTGNISIGNHIGFAIMFSPRLKVTHNVSKNDRDHGLFFNYANYSDIHRNVVKNSDNECLFIYNANFNKFHENLFESCQIGVHFTAGSERNEIYENGFVNNRIQVKYVGTRWLDWSEKGRGNYWSDNAAFDLDGDGISDTAYRPNDVMELILWSVPAAKILANSPSVQLIRWAQSVFPALQTGGVIDTAPLMRPPHVESPKAFSRTR